MWEAFIWDNGYVMRDDFKSNVNYQNEIYSARAFVYANLSLNTTW